MELVPIKIYIAPGMTPQGAKQMAYPNLNDLKPELRGHMDWCYFVDSFGIGLMYDKIDNLGNGQDHEYAYTCVPEPFARAAVATFPDQVTIVSEKEMEDFYNNKSRCFMETEVLDRDALQTIAARVQLEKDGIAPLPSKEIQELRRQCLDPECQHRPGIRKNLRKTWKLFKESTKVTIKQ